MLFYKSMLKLFLIIETMHNFHLLVAGRYNRKREDRTLCLKLQNAEVS